MKTTDDESATDSGRRGLFRRSRRIESAPGPDPAAATRSAVATVDDLARRMDELASFASAGTSTLDTPVRESIETQRAMIARANDIAAGNVAQPTVTHRLPTITTPSIPSPQPIASATPTEAPVQQSDTNTAPEPTTTAADAVDDVQARIEAALTAVSVPATIPVPVPSSAPATAPAAEPMPAATIVPTTSTGDATPVPATTAPAPLGTAAAAFGIDIDRVTRLIEDEAASVQQRIEIEIRGAQLQAAEILDRAEDEAGHIREHGQAQARVLLGEVEEIISEAQQTGEQILLRANDEAGSLRGEATAVLQQAQSEARGVIDNARREGEQVLAEQRRLATVRAQEAMREQDRLKDQIRRLEERRHQVLDSLEPLISQLTQMMPAGVASANVVQLQRPEAQG